MSSKRRQTCSVFLLLLLLTGCVGASEAWSKWRQQRLAYVDDWREEERAKAKRWQEWHHIDELCPEQADGSPCGLLWDEIGSDEFLAEFVSNACDLPTGTMTTECSQTFSRMFIARLMERYTSADTAKVKMWCDAYPVECKDSRKLELKMLHSHNENVAKTYVAHLEKLDRAHEEFSQATWDQTKRAERERREGWRDALRGLSAGLKGFSDPYQQSKPVVCTTYGNTTVCR